MSELTPLQQASARHRLYGLLGQLLADGLGPELRLHVQALPALQPLVDLPPDELAAEHTRWFTHELSPHASAFLVGTLGGPAVARARALQRSAGVHSGRTDLEDDHLAVTLATLAHLCAAELEAREDGVDPEPLQRLQRQALGELQGWLPLLTSAVEGPWSCVTGLLQELVDDHHPVEERTLPEVERTDADTLLVPARAGLACTWTFLSELGMQAGLGLGFGSKRRALRSLLDDDDGRVLLAEALVERGPEGWRGVRERHARNVRGR